MPQGSLQISKSNKNRPSDNDQVDIPETTTDPETPNRPETSVDSPSNPTVDLPNLKHKILRLRTSLWKDVYVDAFSKGRFDDLAAKHARYALKAFDQCFNLDEQ